MRSGGELSLVELIGRILQESAPMEPDKAVHYAQGLRHKDTAYLEKIYKSVRERAQRDDDWPGWDGVLVLTILIGGWPPGYPTPDEMREGLLEGRASSAAKRKIDAMPEYQLFPLAKRLLDIQRIPIIPGPAGSAAGHTLGDLAKVKKDMRKADFWLTADGQPTRTFKKSYIGIKIQRTDVLLPDYAYYMLMHLANQGIWCPPLTVEQVRSLSLQTAQ